MRIKIDRHSDIYKQIYKQRTASERINSQAKDFGIERPKVRNCYSIINLNTLTYIVINIRALRRIRKLKAQAQGSWFDIMLNPTLYSLVVQPTSFVGWRRGFSWKRPAKASTPLEFLCIKTILLDC